MVNVNIYTTFVYCKLKKYPCQTEQSDELHPAPDMLLSHFLSFCLSVVSGVDTSSAVWGPSSVLYIYMLRERKVCHLKKKVCHDKNSS